MCDETTSCGSGDALLLKGIMVVAPRSTIARRALLLTRIAGRALPVPVPVGAGVKGPVRAVATAAGRSRTPVVESLLVPPRIRNAVLNCDALLDGSLRNDALAELDDDEEFIPWDIIQRR